MQFFDFGTRASVTASVWLKEECNQSAQKRKELVMNPEWQLNRRAFSVYLAGLLALRSDLLRGQGVAAVADALAKSNSQFACDLLKQVSMKAPASNHFFSPFSITSALAMALEGARGKTALEIGRALKLPIAWQTGHDLPWNMAAYRQLYKDKVAQLKPTEGTPARRAELQSLKAELIKLNEQAKKLMRQGQFAQLEKTSQQIRELTSRANQIASSIDQYQLTNANSMWVDDTFPLSQSFHQIVQANYGSADAFRCDFKQQAEVERERINQWVSDQTQQKILNLIPEGALTPLTRLVIANAIYFKGNWVLPFETGRTKLARFTTVTGAQLDVSMMNAEAFDVGRYGAFRADGQPIPTPARVPLGAKLDNYYPDQDGFQMAELPYTGDKLSMVIILPSKHDKLDGVMADFTQEKFSACLNALEKRKMQLQLPKFKLESTYDLIPELEAVGMHAAFSPTDADFTGLVDKDAHSNRLFISMIVHKAFLEVNEEGTEAAAATAIGFERTSLPADVPFVPQFNVDRPCIMAIIEKESGMIVFIGKLSNPST